MTELFHSIALALAGVVVFCAMYSAGVNWGKERAADAAVSDDPPAWWLKELALAEGRKKAKAIND